MAATVEAHLNGSLFSARSENSRAGRTIVALHGWGRDRSDFNRLLEFGGVLAFDLPGFGTSPVPNTTWGAHDYARCLAEALSPIVAESGPVVVVGHSFGGRVAVCLASDHPQLVHSLVLVGVPLLRLDNSRRTSRSIKGARWLNRLGILSQDRLESLRYKKGSSDYRSSTGVMRNILVRAINEDYREELANITCPVSLFWGRADTAARFELAEASLALLRGSASLIAVDGGHDVHLTHADELAQVLSRHRAMM